MKKIVQKIVDEYLTIYPKEFDKLHDLISFINDSSDKELNDWNNPKGHLTVGAFIYSKKDKKFLVVYHKDLDMFLYPGGHTSFEDNNPLETAKKEVFEETGLIDLINISLSDNELVPIDIDSHIIPDNSKCNMPTHFHYDFRYLFVLDRIEEVKLDEDELCEYKLIDINELQYDKNYGNIVYKLDELLINFN